MRLSKSGLIPAVVAACAGCASNFGARPPESSSVADAAFKNSDLYSRESRTLSGLATLENGINDYIKDQGKIPTRLEDLIPRYVVEIPVVELGQPRRHGDKSSVRYYPSRIIQNGVIDGSQLKDTGRWGYAHNDKQVVVFVDCTHVNSRGNLWYKERGVF